MFSSIRSSCVLPALGLVFLVVDAGAHAQSRRPFDGKDLSNWLVKGGGKHRWVVAHPILRDGNPAVLTRGTGDGTAAMVNLAAKHGDSSDIYSRARFGSCHIELQVMVPRGSNSGIYVMGEYEVQVLDSFGREKLGAGDMGAIYGAAVPRVNACRKPGVWQRFVIDFAAPRFAEDGRKIANARFLRVELNGMVIQRNVEMLGPTPGGLSGKEAATGPILFQGDHGSVAFRNIVITPGAPAAPAVEASLAIPATDDGLPGSGPIRRYGWFRKLWVRKRTGWARDVKKDQHALVFLGDSILQSWGPRLGGAFPGVKVANRGISGDTTRGMLIRLQEDVLALHPRGVVMLMGTNDLEENATAASIAGNVARIVERLEAYDPTMPIILCKVFPSSASRRRAAEDIKAINRLCAATVKGDARVTVLDTWTLFADAKGDARKSEFPDLLHPNKLGYAKWAAALRPVLATYGFMDTKPDAFELESGFFSLFNGEDLSGWGFRRMKTMEKLCSFDGRARSSKGRYVAENGRLIVMTPPAGRRVQQLWTTREFATDFDLRLEFRATPNADSGVFIRKPQLQCRDYVLAGPYRTLARYKPQDWNLLEVRVRGTTAHCTCNGEVLEAALTVPASGPIGLEGDRGQLEYRRIRIKELRQNPPVRRPGPGIRRSPMSL